VSLHRPPPAKTILNHGLHLARLCMAEKAVLSLT
jgi:hypothetical protein